MIIGNNIGISNSYQNTPSKSSAYKNVREYSKYLMGKYDCLTPGRNVAVSVTPGMLKKAMTDEKTGKWLERVKEKKEEQKKLEQRLIFKGKDLKSVTERFIEEISAANLDLSSKLGFDMKA